MKSLAIILLAASAIGCSSGGDGGCAPVASFSVWQFDEGGCKQSVRQLNNACLTSAKDAKGVVGICALSPEGAVYYSVIGSLQSAKADGWKFVGSGSQTDAAQLTEEQTTACNELHNRANLDAACSN